ncbi:MAG TPA: hypothetical protein VIU64_12870 [Polyangia bacterium]
MLKLVGSRRRHPAQPLETSSLPSPHEARRPSVLRGAGVGLSALAMASVAVFAVGCASTPAASKSAAAPKGATASDYYPLEPGWKWAYDLERNGEHMLAVYQVLERVPDAAIVQAGDEMIAYAVSREGVAQKEGAVVGDFVLKNPVALGVEWPVFAGSAKIAAVDRKISLPSGDYTDCVVVETLRRDPTRMTRTTFARGVGPVAIEMAVESHGQLVTTLRASLRGTTRPGEDPLAIAGN